MADALPVAGLGVGIGHVGAPVAALGAVGVEHALDVHGDVAERIGLARDAGRGRHLGADIGISGERHGLPDRLLDLVVLEHGRGDAHVVEDQGELRVLLGDRSEQRGVARCEAHDGQAGLFGRGREPISSPASPPSTGAPARRRSCAGRLVRKPCAARLPRARRQRHP